MIKQSSKEAFNQVLQILSENKPDYSHSSYDIAIISLIDGPQHEPCIQWLLEHQNADGTWGDAFNISWYDQYICTYAAALALQNIQMLEQAKSAFSMLSTIAKDIAKKQTDYAIETLTFGGLVDVMDHFCLSKGWPKPQHEANVQKIIEEENQKWDRILKWDQFYNGDISIVGHCGERVYGDSRVDLNRFLTAFQDENGSISTSPAATAFFLFELMRRKHDIPEQSLNRLREYIYAKNPYINPVGCLDSGLYFTIAWGLMILAELKIPYQQTMNKIFPQLASNLENMYQNLMMRSQGMLTAAVSSTIPGDADSTSVALTALNYTGYDVSKQFNKLDFLYKADKGYYQTFLYERDPSISTNLHMIEYLSQHNLSRLNPILDWLQSVAKNVKFICKWHVSPMYSLGEMARILAKIDHPVAKSLSLHSTKCLLEMQKESGGWGIATTASIEETGYAVLGLASVFDYLIQKQSNHSEINHLRKPISQALKKASDFLHHTQIDSRPLWTGKSLYAELPLIPILKVVSLARIQDLNESL